MIRHHNAETDFPESIPPFRLTKSSQLYFLLFRSWDKDVVVCPLMARANHSCRPNAEFVARIDQGNPLYIIIRINIYTKQNQGHYYFVLGQVWTSCERCMWLRRGRRWSLQSQTHNLNHKLTELFIFCFCVKKTDYHPYIPCSRWRSTT